MIIKRCLWVIGILFCLVVINYTASAEECIVKKKNNDCTYRVEINGQVLLAITEETAEKGIMTKKELENARKEIARLETIVNEYGEYRKQSEITLKGKDDIIKRYKELVDLYRRLSQNYSKLKTPLMTAEVGVGITGSDTQPAVIAGLGFKKIRLFGFFQKQNAGVMVGFGLPLF